MAGSGDRLNEWLFAVDAARGLGRAELAERHGISRWLVARLLTGRKRPHVLQTISALRSVPDADTRLRVAALQARALEVFERALGAGDRAGRGARVDSVSLSAAREVLTRTLGGQWGPRLPASGQPGKAGRLDILALSPETRRRVLAELRTAADRPGEGG